MAASSIVAEARRSATEKSPSRPRSRAAASGPRICPMAKALVMAAMSGVARSPAISRAYAVVLIGALLIHAVIVVAAVVGAFGGKPREDYDIWEFVGVVSIAFALFWASWYHMLYGHYAEAQSLLDELSALADEKDASLFWKATEIAFRGALFALTGKASDAGLFTAEVPR